MANFLGNLYYTIGLIPCILALLNVFGYFRFFSIVNWMIKFKKVTGQYPTSKDYRVNQDYHFFMTYCVYATVVFFWLLFGVITQSWYVYFTLIIFIIFFLKIGKFIKSDNVNMLIGFFLSIIKFLIILILIINHFHFHYDWLNLFN